jgi:putative massive surface protein mspD
LATCIQRLSQPSISDSENIPQLNGQQAPITYGEVKKGKYNNGSPDTVVGKILSEELGGPVTNFSNEQIRDAVARYNQKNSQKNNSIQDPLETYYPQWSAAVKQSNPNAEIIRDTDGKYYVEGVTKNRVAVIYENPYLVRLVNATTNLHVEF